MHCGSHSADRHRTWERSNSVIDAATRGGAIVLCPLGYHRASWYGSRSRGLQAPGIWGLCHKARDMTLEGELGEKDVLEAIEQVRAAFTVDPQRISLWGHSMGGAGTLHIAIKHPGMFASIGLVAPALPPVQQPGCCASINCMSTTDVVWTVITIASLVVATLIKSLVWQIICVVFLFLRACGILCCCRCCPDDGYVHTIDDLELIKHIPTIVISGQADKLVRIEGPRGVAARMHSLGMTHEYLERESDDHATVIKRDNMDRLFAFLLAHTLPGGTRAV